MMRSVDDRLPTAWFYLASKHDERTEEGNIPETAAHSPTRHEGGGTPENKDHDSYLPELRVVLPCPTKGIGQGILAFLVPWMRDPNFTAFVESWCGPPFSLYYQQAPEHHKGNMRSV